MATNDAPVFPLTPLIGVVLVTTANTDRDGTGTIADVTAAAGAEGARYEFIRAVAIDDTTAGGVTLFVHDGSGWFYLGEIPVTAVTVSTSQAAFSGEFVPTKPIVLPSGYKLGAATTTGEDFHVFAFGGSLTA